MARKKKQEGFIGPYQLRGELGRGAMAVVWRAFDPTLEREVAVKEPVMPAGADSVTAAELSARFVREGKAAAQLNHPGIVTIYGADIYDGRPAIVMELIEGRTLSQVIDSGRLTPAATVAIIDQLLDAVAFAHARGVVHRDIKPDNIFVTDDGRVKLADFGIAHVGTSSTMTQAGQVLGTPGYMAPEQVVGSPVDARADLFAIGVIAYELLTGANPFGATDATPPTTVLYRIVHEEPQTPAAIDPAVPQWLAAVVGRAMAKDPAVRYQAAEEMRNDLRNQSVSRPGSIPSTAPFAPAGNLPKPAGNNNTYWAIGGAAALIVVALVFVFSSSSIGGGHLLQSGTAPVPTAAPEPAPKPAAPAPAAKTSSDITSRARLDASSVNEDDWGKYGPRNVADGNRTTCWEEGRGGYGIGEWVSFSFPGRVTVTEVHMVPGYDKNIDGWNRWWSNGRVRRFTVQFGDNSTQSFATSDSPDEQTFTLSAPTSTSYLKVIVDDAYPAEPGEHYAEDTSISELSVWGY